LKHASPAAGLPPQVAALATPFLQNVVSVASAPVGNGEPQPALAVAALCANAAQSASLITTGGASVVPAASGVLVALSEQAKSPKLALTTTIQKACFIAT
jgi:hypothetical protein